MQRSAQCIVLSYLRFCHRHRQNLPHVAVLCLQVSKQRMPEILKEVPDWRPVKV